LLPLRLTGQPLAGDRKHSFTVKQPELPLLDKPAVRNVRAVTTGRQVAVTWEIPDTASPAFAYKVEVFDHPECRGDAKAVKEERLPTGRQALLDVTVPSPTIRLTVTDIFDQAALPIVVTATMSPPPAAAHLGTKTAPGLAYALYQKDSKRKTNYFNPPLQQPNEEHHWLTLEEIAQGQLIRRGLARGFDLTVREQRNSGYALVFQGLLRVPDDGFYLLRAQVDGGYRIQVDNEDVLTWDGQHGTTEKAALRNFATGDHALTVSYLYDQLPARNFSIEWEGPHLPRQPVPLEALRIPEDDAYPVPAIRANAPGDGTGRVAVQVDARGHVINKTALYLGQLQLVESKGATLQYDGPLPRGSNTLWCRVILMAIIRWIHLRPSSTCPASLSKGIGRCATSATPKPPPGSGRLVPEVSNSSAMACTPSPGESPGTSPPPVASTPTTAPRANPSTDVPGLAWPRWNTVTA